MQMFKIYKVSDGEDINSIATKFSTTTEEILEINGYDRGYRADAGNLLIVPNNNLIFSRYIVQKGDTIFEIAKRVETDPMTLLKINGLDEDDYIYPDQTILVPNQGMGVYVTNVGDTLTDVASKFRTTKDKIVAANDDLLLAPDQVIIYKKEIIA